MSIDQKRKLSKQIHGNQNYLNFIKKNHQLIQQEFNGFISPKISGNEKAQSQGSGKFPYKISENVQSGISTQQLSPTRSIHDSLSKFKLGNNQLNQISDIYSIERGMSIVSDHNNYEDILEKNNEIAANLLNNRTKHAKHEAAKQLLFHLNKNRSFENKKIEFKSITLDRYSSIPEATELNLKFPVIEKKVNATISVENQIDKKPYPSDLRGRLKSIEKRQKIKNPGKEIQGEVRMSSHKQGQSQVKLLQKSRQLQDKFKIRQELYGLLPVFKTPNVHSEVKKNKILMQSKNRLKIQKSNPPLRQFLQDYLQKNIILKSSPYANTKKIEKEVHAQINRQILDSTVLDHKQQLQLIQNKKPEEIKKTDSQLGYYQNPSELNEVSKQGDAKTKPKKVQLTELKYEGDDLSIYDIKIRYYREFIFMINLTHRVFDPLLLKDAVTIKPENKYKFYMGKGNNYLLVKSLLKRRFWWIQEEDPKKANFVWTQLKVNYFYQFQKKAEILEKHHKLDKDFELPQSPKKKKKKAVAESKPQPVKAGIFRAPLPANNLKIFTKSDKKYYDQFLQKAVNPEKLLKFTNRLKFFDENFFRQRIEDKSSERVHNHLEYNYFIGNKKALFYNLKQYYDLQKKNVFQIIPLTFHIKHGTTDHQYQIFTKEFKRLAKQKTKKKGLKNVWIVKPGQLSNRGQGITVIDEIYELNNILKKKQKHFNGTEKTYIVQKYIESPLLYKGRKFDIRHYMMISRLHGVMRAYWFGQGYIRTSSYDFNIDQIGDEVIHLTNDAIQKYCDGYGKYEEGNKVSYNEFQRYMDSTYGQGNFSFSEMIYPKMKAIALDAVKATYLYLDPNNTQHNFQIFGLDFMIDSNYEVWLIEVNTNPCLQLSSKLLGRIIPTMLEHSLRLTLDVIFPPPSHYPNSQKYLAPDNPLQRLLFQLIFDEGRDGKEIEQLYAGTKLSDMGAVDEEDETYQNDGKEIQLDNELD